MVSRSNLLSPIDLNNRGVCLLVEGQGEDAARFFRKACKMAVSMVSHLQTGERNTDHERAEFTSSFSKSSRSLHDSVHETTKSKGIPQPTSGEPSCQQSSRKRKASCQQSSRKRKARDISFLITDPTHNLGRPLWIPSQEERMALSGSRPLIATTLYNFGLSLHLIAASNPNKEAAIPMYNKALAIYKTSCEIMMHGPLSNTLRCPVFLLTLHNMTLLYAVLGDREQETIHHGWLVDFLCLMGSKGAFRKSRFEAFYASHLSLSRANNTAAAA